MEGNKSWQKPVKIGKISKSSIIVDSKLLEGSKSSLKSLVRVSGIRNRDISTFSAQKMALKKFTREIYTF